MNHKTPSGLEGHMANVLHSYAKEKTKIETLSNQQSKNGRKEIEFTALVLTSSMKPYTKHFFGSILPLKIITSKCRQESFIPKI